MKKILAILFVLVMVASLMVGCGEDTTKTTAADATTTTTTAATTTTSTTAATKTYDQILAKYGITHISSANGENTASFANEEDGIVDIMDYGYNNEGIVCEIIETTYMPFGDTYTQEYAEALDEVMAEEYAHFDSLDCASVESKFEDNIYILIIKYTDLDNLDNIRALYEAEIFAEAYSYYNMSDAAAELIAEGYVQK